MGMQTQTTTDFAEQFSTWIQVQQPPLPCTPTRCHSMLVSFLMGPSLMPRQPQARNTQKDSTFTIPKQPVSLVKYDHLSNFTHMFNDIQFFVVENFAIIVSL